MKDTVYTAHKGQTIAAKGVEEFRKIEAEVQSVEKKYAVAQYLYLEERCQKQTRDLKDLQTADANDAAVIEQEKERIRQLELR